MKLNIDLNENGRYFEIDNEMKYYRQLYIYVEDDLIFNDNINTKNNIYNIYISSNVLKIIENDVEIKTLNIESEFTIWFRNMTLIYNNMIKRDFDGVGKKRIASKRDYTKLLTRNISELKYIFDIYHEGQLIESVELNSENNYNTELKNNFDFEELVFIERDKPEDVQLTIKSYKLRNGGEIIEARNQTPTFYRHLKYNVYFKITENDYIDTFKNITINSIRFKISKNDYNGNDDVKEYYFIKKAPETNPYYESRNELDYEAKTIGSGYIIDENNVIDIEEIIINNRYKISNFNVSHSLTLLEIVYDNNKQYQIFQIVINIILDENKTKIVDLKSSKYSKLLKLLKKYLNSNDSKIKTLYNDLLNKISEENILIVVPSSIININSLLKLLSKYLGTKSKNPNILYRLLLNKSRL